MKQNCTPGSIFVPALPEGTFDNTEEGRKLEILYTREVEWRTATAQMFFLLTLLATLAPIVEGTFGPMDFVIWLSSLVAVVGGLAFTVRQFVKDPVGRTKRLAGLLAN
jgi:hypothetical protein